MSRRINKIGVWLETDEEGIRPGARRALSLASSISENIKVQALAVTGAPDDLATASGDYGADELIFLRVPGAEKSPDAVAAAVAWHVRNARLSDLVADGTSTGRDLLARVAAILDAPLLQDCIQVDFSAGEGVKYLLSGRVTGRYTMPGPVNIYGLRPNVFKTSGPVSKKAAEVLKLDPPSKPAKVRVLEQVCVAGGPDLLEAGIIVSGGRALGSAENFSLVRECAEALGGAAGASRSAVDLGYARPSMQVGQTGVVVSPNLYIACGISGSVYHMAGIKTSRAIVSINTDKTAPIFARSDFGLQGDLFIILPLLRRIVQEN